VRLQTLFSGIRQTDRLPGFYGRTQGAFVKYVIASLLTALFLCASQTLAGDSPQNGFRSDIEYGRAGDVSLKLDAFVPEGTGPFSTCILVHGGGFTKGDKRSSAKHFFEPLSKAGFTWFAINYRLAPEHRWPACVEDVNTAIRWVRAHAAEFKVDVDRIALIGESAGGYLVGYVGARGTGDTRVTAVVPFYAALDREFQIRYFNKLGGSTAALLGVTELNDETWRRLREISANTYLHAEMPPYLLIHGDQDDQVPFEQSERFQRQMKMLGNRCDLIAIPGGGHGMSGWEKLNSDYKTQLINWLHDVLGKRD
jgi:alpha-L-fucosidase 2